MPKLETMTWDSEFYNKGDSYLKKLSSIMKNIIGL